MICDVLDVIPRLSFKREVEFQVDCVLSAIFVGLVLYRLASTKRKELTIKL